MKSLGIDIGSSSIKVALASESSKGIVLESFGEHPYGLHAGHDSAFEVLEILQKIRTSVDPTKTRIVCAIRQEFASVRLKAFPFAERFKILKSLPFELEEELPLSTENAIFDARYVGERVTPDENGKSITDHQFLAVAVPKFRIEKLLDVFHSANLTPDVMSIEGFATFNTFIGQFSREDQELQVILQFGHDHTLVYAHRGRTLLGIRSVLWGAKHVLQALVKKYEVPYNEAMRELKTKGFYLVDKSTASYDQVNFSDVIYQQIAEGSKEIRLSILEIENEFGATIGDVRITGGLSNVENIHAALTMLLERSVNPFSYMSSLSTTFESRTFSEFSYATAVGLAFEGLKKPKSPPLQLLRGDFAKDNQYFGSLVNRWGATARFLSASFILFFIFAGVRDNMTTSLLGTLDSKIEDTAKTQGKLPPKQATLTGLRNITKEKKRQAAEASSFDKVSGMNSPLDLLKRVSDAVPSRARLNFQLTRFRVIDNTIQFSGTLVDKTQMNTLADSIKRLALPNSFRVLINKMDQTPAVFAYELKLDRGVKR